MKGKSLLGSAGPQAHLLLFEFQDQSGLWKGWAIFSSGYRARSKEGMAENADVDLRVENPGAFCQDTSPGADQHHKVPEGVGVDLVSSQHPLVRSIN